MNEAMWKKEDSVGAQLTPNWAIYAEAMNRFTQSATAFMEHVHLLTEAREAYEEAIKASEALRDSLDSGDQTLRSLRSQLARVVNDHLDEPAFDRKKPELLKSNGGKAFP
jgi:exonuclease VII small subunit